MLAEDCGDEERISIQEFLRDGFGRDDYQLPTWSEPPNQNTCIV